MDTDDLNLEPEPELNQSELNQPLLTTSIMHTLPTAPTAPTPPTPPMEPNDTTDTTVPMDPMDTMEPETPMILPIPISLSQLMGLSFMNTPTDHENSLEEQIQQQSFHEQNKYKQVCNKDFINSLSVQKVNSDMISQGLSCGICLEEFKLGENVIELPCLQKHYFHIKTCECGGIYPWLRENNSCPMCRFEFPSEEKEIEPPEITEPTEDIPLPRPINLMNIINHAIQEQEERMLQETILESLNDFQS